MKFDVSIKPGYVIDYDNWSYASKLLINQQESDDDRENYGNKTASRILISSILQEDCNV